MTTLIDLNDLKDFLVVKTSSSDQDGRLSNIALQVTSLISSYCGREFVANTHTEIFDGGTSSVYISNPPINKINELSYYNGTDYQILGGPDTNGQPIVIDGPSHLVSVTGNAHLSTRVKKFNKSSIRLDGSSYASIADSGDWELGVDDFTLETFARFDNVSVGSQKLISSGNSTHNWNFFVAKDNVCFVINTNSAEVANIRGAHTSANNRFSHYAVSRKDGTFYIAKDGDILTTSSSEISVPDYNSGIKLGDNMIGYLDNLRINHDAKYVADYTTAAFPMSADNYTKLLVRFDGENNSTTLYDVSRNVNQYSFSSGIGEINFEDTAQNDLRLSALSQSGNYANGVKIVYEGGFTNVPDDIKLAALEMAKLIYKGKTGTESNSLQGESISTLRLSSDDFPPQVRRILNLYRLLN